MKVVAILQQRLGNTRCPGKGNLMLAGKTMDLNIVERVQRSKLIHQVVLACPPSDEDSFSYLPCRIHAPLVDENDLVGRYLVTAERCHADLIVRIPCDNPCVQDEFIDEAIKKYLGRPQVYVSTFYRHVKDRVYVDGVGAEVFSISRLRWLDQATKGSPFYREHPHKLFEDQGLIDGWEQYLRYADADKTIRLDVNTEKDYLFIKDIYDHFGDNKFHVNEVLAYLESKSAV
jgi:spore coat polysaccharide biosynthesis protein SpsF